MESKTQEAWRCRNCKNDARLRDEDAGTIREELRLCPTCFSEHPQANTGEREEEKCRWIGDCDNGCLTQCYDKSLKRDDDVFFSQQVEGEEESENSKKFWKDHSECFPLESIKGEDVEAADLKRNFEDILKQVYHNHCTVATGTRIIMSYTKSNRQQSEARIKEILIEYEKQQHFPYDWEKQKAGTITKIEAFLSKLK